MSALEDIIRDTLKDSDIDFMSIGRSPSPWLFRKREAAQTAAMACTSRTTRSTRS